MQRSFEIASTTRSQTHKCVPFGGNAHVFAYRSSEIAPAYVPKSNSEPPSGFEEIIGFAKSDELLHDFDIMLEMASTERGRGEVNLSPEGVQTLRLRSADSSYCY